MTLNLTTEQAKILFHITEEFEWATLSDSTQNKLIELGVEPVEFDKLMWDLFDKTSVAIY